MGARSIQHHLEEKLGVHTGETTEDGEFTLFTAECLAGCGQGPMLQLNDEYHENLTPERVDQILVEARRSKDARCKVTHSPVGIRGRASK
jgi:NADH:ubiquinone oxidoreductase subunit E